MLVRTVCRKVLTDAELQRCLEAGDMGLELNNAKAKIFDYVESRMCVGVRLTPCRAGAQRGRAQRPAPG